MSSLEEQRKRRVSIRPNGKIRPVPKNTSAEISFDDIQQGNVMANFQGEYDFGRYYKAKNIDTLLKSQFPINPQTRRAILRDQIETYSASLNGNMNGTHVPPSFNSLYPRLPIGLHAAAQPVNTLVRFRTLAGRNYTDTFRTDQAMSSLVQRFNEFRNRPEVLGFIDFVGIPLRESAHPDQNQPVSFLLYPFLSLTSGYRNVSKDLSRPLGDFNIHNDPNMDLFVVPRQSRVGLLSIMINHPESYEALYSIPHPEVSDSDWENTLNDKWIAIRNEVSAFIVGAFVSWLTDHQNEYSMYKYSQFSGTLLDYTEVLLKQALEVFEKKINEVVEEYNKLAGGKRKQRKQAKKTKKTRKNRRSQ